MNKTCELCLYFIPPSAGSFGDCVRYPHAVKKMREQWCGEWVLGIKPIPYEEEVTAVRTELAIEPKRKRGRPKKDADNE